MISATIKKEHSSDSSADPEETIKFIDGARPGRKVLIFDGNIFYFHSINRQSTYFKCSHKHKGCSASITVKNFNKKNCSYDSFIVAKREHSNHLRSQEEIRKKEERAKKNLEKAQADVDSEKFRNSKHVCLFCLSMLPANYLDITTLENMMPSGHLLSFALDDPVKNSQSFDLLCVLLNIKWRRNQEGKYFDQGRCLPLCHNCQILYQNIVQLNLQIRELEVLLNNYTRVIRDEICRSENVWKKMKYKSNMESVQLALLGLHMFRRKVVDPACSRDCGEDAFIEDSSNSSIVKHTKDQSALGTISPSNLKGKPAEKNTTSFKESDTFLLIKQEIDEVHDVDETMKDLIDEEDNFLMRDDVDVSTAKNVYNMDIDSGGEDGVNKNCHGEKSEFRTENCLTRRTRGRTSGDEIPKEKIYVTEKTVEVEDDDDDKEDVEDINFSDSELAEEDDDSDFEGKKRSTHQRMFRKCFTSHRGRRFQTKRHTSSPYPSAYKPKKVNSCHICSFTVTGRKLFMDHYKQEHPDDPLYTCKFCRKQYERLRDVVIHQRRHTGERPFQCQNCSASYVSSSHLRLHVLSRHKKSTFPCTKCNDKEFASKILLNNHLAVMHGKVSKNLFYSKSKKPVKSFTCHLCDEEIIGGGPFLQHYRDLHPKEKRFTCKFCKRHFPYIRQVLTHQRRHTGEMPFACENCDKRFLNERNLRYHRINTHSEREKIYACPLCPKKYPLKQSLTGHMYSHREYIVICKMCGRTFRTMSTFRKHNRIAHSSQAEPSEPVTDPSKVTFESLGVEIQCKQKCHVCMIPIPGKVFIRKHFAEAHPDHPGDEKTCVCGQQFKNYKEVFKHAIRKHVGNEKPFQCEQCPYTCITLKELRTHSNIHVPIEERHKNHICSVCGLGFASNQTLAIHGKKHKEGDRTKFVCELCGKSYAEQRGLKHHMKTNHFKLLPHKCHYEGCGKAFPLRATLARHLNIHTGEHSYKCNVCNKSFHYEESRRRHLRKVHGVDTRKHQPRSRKGKKIVGGLAVADKETGGAEIEKQNSTRPLSMEVVGEDSFLSERVPVLSYLNSTAAGSDSMNYHDRCSAQLEVFFEGGLANRMVLIPSTRVEIEDEKKSDLTL